MCTDYVISCSLCETEHIIQASEADVNKWANGTGIDAWVNGEWIGECMPYLSENERSLFVYRICGDCLERV